MAEVAGQERYSDWYYLKLVTDAVTEDGDSADNGTDTSITDQLSLGSCRGAVIVSTQYSADLPAMFGSCYSHRLSMLLSLLIINNLRDK